MSPRRIKWGLAALAATAVVATGCERIEIRSIESGPELPDAGPPVAALFLQPSYFSTATQDPQESVVAGALLAWEGGTLEGIIDDNSSLVMGPLEASFELLDLELVPDGARKTLAVRGTYATEPLRTVIRIEEGGDTSLCRVDLDFGERSLEFDLTPTVENGIGHWNTAVVVSFQGENEVLWSQPEPCDYPIEELDWDGLSGRLDSLLAGSATGEFIPQVRALVVDQISVPAGGLQLLPLTKGFFEPTRLQIETRVAAEPPWTGQGFGLDDDGRIRMALAVVLDGDLASCVEGLALDSPPAQRLNALTPPPTTPSGEAYDMALAFDRGLLQSVLDQLVLTGQLCADLPLSSATGLAPLSSLLPNINRAEGYEFDRDGRLRVLPNGQATVAFESTALGFAIESLDLDLYGQSDDVLVRVAQADGRVTGRIAPRFTADGLALEPLEVAIDLDGSDDEVLRDTGLDIGVDAVAEALIDQLIARRIEVPVPEPFGFRYDLLEMDPRADAVWIYLALVPATTTIEE